MSQERNDLWKWLVEMLHFKQWDWNNIQHLLSKFNFHFGLVFFSPSAWRIKRLCAIINTEQFFLTVYLTLCFKQTALWMEPHGSPELKWVCLRHYMGRVRLFLLIRHDSVFPGIREARVAATWGRIQLSHNINCVFILQESGPDSGTTVP